MARPKLYDKRFHFNGPAELDARVHALAERRTATGVKTTPSDVLREALSAGLDLLEPDTRYAHATGVVGAELRALDADDVDAAAEVIDSLVDLGDAVGRLDVEALKALAELDVDVLQGLGRLDPESLDAMAGLDVEALAALAALEALAAL